MDFLSRLFVLTTKAKILIIAIVALAFLCLSGLIAYFFLRGEDPQIIAAFTAILSSLGPAALLSMLVIFSERNEQIELIGRQSDVFLRTTVPSLIGGRYIGEPFDAPEGREDLTLEVQLFHEIGSPHAGYVVTAGGHQFAFTLVLNVYRLTLCVPVALSTGAALESEVAENCDHLIASGFKATYASIGDGKETMVLLRKEFLDASRDFIFSRREQFFTGREIAEFARTGIRALLYDGGFPLMPAYFDPAERSLLTGPTANRRCASEGIAGGRS